MRKRNGFLLTPAKMKFVQAAHGRRWARRGPAGICAWYTSPTKKGWSVFGDGLPARRQTAQSVPTAKKETWTMNEQRFPAGWDEQRVKRLRAELHARTDEDWIAAD